MNAARAEVNRASDLQNPVRQVRPLEQREPHRRRRNRVACRSDAQVSSQVLGGVAQDTLLRRVAAECLRRNNLEASPAGHANVGLAAEVSPLEFVNR